MDLKAKGILTGALVAALFLPCAALADEDRNSDIDASPLTKHLGCAMAEKKYAARLLNSRKNAASSLLG